MSEEQETVLLDRLAFELYRADVSEPDRSSQVAVGSWRECQRQGNGEPYHRLAKCVVQLLKTDGQRCIRARLPLDCDCALCVLRRGLDGTGAA